jgi:hypothetical protein
MRREPRDLRRRPTCHALAALLALSLGGSAQAAPAASRRSAGQQTAAMLPLRGATELVAPLSALLERRWQQNRSARSQAPGRKRRRGQLLPPRALRSKLAAVPSIRAALDAARQSLASAEQAALHMKRQVALKAARAALVQLRRVHARHQAAELVARAHVAEGLALLLHPPAPKAALRAFRQAYGAAPSYKVDPDSVPSRTALLLDRARQSAGRPQQPTIAEMAHLASWAAVERLVWAAGRRDGSDVILVVATYDRGQRALAGQQHRLSKASASPAKLMALLPGLPLMPRRGPRPPVDRSSAWYRRWWVWALVGAVCAGSAVAITAAVQTNTGRSYSFDFVRRP